MVEVAAPLIVSSFLLYHYVLDMYGMCRLKHIVKISLRLTRVLEFDPITVFGSLY